MEIPVCADLRDGPYRLRGNAYDNLGDRQKALEDWAQAARLGDVLLQSSLDKDYPEIESLTSIIPGANWAEREVQDLLGIKVNGHVDPRRLAQAIDLVEPHGARRVARCSPTRSTAASALAPSPAITEAETRLETA